MGVRRDEYEDRAMHRGKRGSRSYGTRHIGPRARTKATTRLCRGCNRHFPVSSTGSLSAHACSADQQA